MSCVSVLCFSFGLKTFVRVALTAEANFRRPVARLITFVIAAVPVIGGGVYFVHSRRVADRRLRAAVHFVAAGGRADAGRTQLEVVGDGLVDVLLHDGRLAQFALLGGSVQRECPIWEVVRLGRHRFRFVGECVFQFLPANRSQPITTHHNQTHHSQTHHSQTDRNRAIAICESDTSYCVRHTTYQKNRSPQTKYVLVVNKKTRSLSSSSFGGNSPLTITMSRSILSSSCEWSTHLP